MATSDYSINGYRWLFINAIGDYSINGYLWLIY